MRKTILTLSVALLATEMVLAADIHVKSFKYAGPFALQRPLMVDSVNLSDKKFTPESLLDTPIGNTVQRYGCTRRKKQIRLKSPGLHAQ